MPRPTTRTFARSNSLASLVACRPVTGVGSSCGELLRGGQIATLRMRDVTCAAGTVNGSWGAAAAATGSTRVSAAASAVRMPNLVFGEASWSSSAYARFMRLSPMTVFLGLALAVVTAGSAEAEPDLSREGFRVGPSDLIDTVSRICLTPLESDLEILEWESRAAWIEQFLAHKLAHAGFETVPSARVAEARAAAEREAGGIYDTLTGRAMPAKRAGVESAQRAALARLGCKAVLHAEIHLVRLRWETGVASWDYVRHSMGGGELYLGTADGLSLWLALRTLDGTELLVRAGGIEPLWKLEGGGFWSDPEWQDAHPQALLQTPHLNARAVIAALGALAEPAAPEIVACVDAAAKTTRKLDRVAQRAACEVERFTFVAPPKKSPEEAVAE